MRSQVSTLLANHFLETRRACAQRCNVGQLPLIQLLRDETRTQAWRDSDLRGDISTNLPLMQNLITHWGDLLGIKDGHSDNDLHAVKFHQVQVTISMSVIVAGLTQTLQFLRSQEHMGA